jgi:hypothetical protein
MWAVAGLKTSNSFFVKIDLQAINNDDFGCNFYSKSLRGKKLRNKSSDCH